MRIASCDVNAFHFHYYNGFHGVPGCQCQFINLTHTCHSVPIFYHALYYNQWILTLRVFVSLPSFNVNWDLSQSINTDTETVKNVLLTVRRVQIAQLNCKKTIFLLRAADFNTADSSTLTKEKEWVGGTGEKPLMETCVRLQPN